MSQGLHDVCPTTIGSQSWQIFYFKALLERFANNLPVLLWEKMKELLRKPISSDVFVGVLVS